MRRFFAVLEDLTGKLAPMPGVFPDMADPVVRDTPTAALGLS